MRSSYVSNPVAAAAQYPTTMPMRMQNRRSWPLFQILRPIITASEAPVTMASFPDSASEPGCPVRVRNAASPTFTPIRKTTRPAVSDGISVRNRVHTRESRISTSPAKIVMPHSSGRPPAFTASNDGAR